jgi:hypothetical protein
VKSDRGRKAEGGKWKMVGGQGKGGIDTHTPRAIVQRISRNNVKRRLRVKSDHAVREGRGGEFGYQEAHSNTDQHGNTFH